MGDGRKAVALHRADGNVASVATKGRTAQQIGQVFDPVTKGAGGNPLGIVLVVVEETKDVVGQELSNGEGHAGETLHEEIDGLLAVKLERRAHALRSIRPRVIVVQPKFRVRTTLV